MVVRRVNEEGESHEGVDIRKASQPLLGLTSKIEQCIEVHWNVQENRIKTVISDPLLTLPLLQILWLKYYITLLVK